jgi:hypothetical protein
MWIAEKVKETGLDESIVRHAAEIEPTEVHHRLIASLRAELEDAKGLAFRWQRNAELMVDERDELRELVRDLGKIRVWGPDDGPSRELLEWWERAESALQRGKP